MMSDTTIARAGEAEGPLEFTAGTWGFFGWSLLVMLGEVLIIPSPWTSAAYYRWCVAHVRVPGARQPVFTGTAGDIWWAFVLLGLLGYAGAYSGWLELALAVFEVLLYWVVIRWFFAKLSWQDQTAPFAFTGSYWGLLGWSVLCWLSIFTIIGWAWAIPAMTRWICRNVQGGQRPLAFTATGLGLLWRSIVLVLCSILIIPIPWISRWYAAWLVSQFYLGTPPRA